MQDEMENMEGVEELDEESGFSSYEEIIDAKKITFEDVKEHMTGPVISTVLHIILLAFLGTIIVFEAPEDDKEIAVEMKVLEPKEIEPPPPPPEEPPPTEDQVPTETPVERPNVEVDVNVQVDKISVDNPNEIDMPSMLNVKMSNSALTLAVPAGGGSGGIKGRFLGTGGSGSRFVFIIDYSASMSNTQLLVVKSHLMKALRAFGGKGQIAVLFFAGPVWLPQQSGKLIDAEWGGHSHYKQDMTAKYPHPKWMKPNKHNLDILDKYICQTPRVWGTNWSHPFKVALSMKPRPSVIFFMTDGNVSGDIVAECKNVIGQQGKNVTINTISFGLKSGGSDLEELAKMSRGGVYKGYSGADLEQMAQGVQLPQDFTSNTEFDYSAPRGVKVNKEKKVQGLEIK